jgi:AraC-like DNA-binding protein
MEMYDVKVIEYAGKPLFQSAKMVSPNSFRNTFQDMACFFYVLKGHGNLIESNGSHTIGKNEGLVKSCGNFISSYYKDVDGCDFEAIVIYFYPDVIKEIYSELVPQVINEDLTAKPPQRIIGNELIEQFINGMQLYFENQDLMDENLSRLKIKELLMILLKSNYFEGIVDLFNGLFSSGDKTFRDIVEKNICSNISLDQLAFLTNRSLSTFKRTFKKEFNESPARYIKRRRLEKAAEELIVSDDSITEIAFECGFQDLSTFSSVFREAFSESPSEYRMNRIRKSLDQSRKRVG